MAGELLGESFDIHGGGLDLQFPHHENEIAQSCCAHPGAGFARYWLHNQMVQVEGKKMSKSLGNFFTVRDLLDQGFPGEVIRFVMLSTHYRKPMDWTEKKAREAEAALRKWHGLVGDTKPGAVSVGVIEAVADDLNTPLAISELHRLAGEGDASGLAASASLLGLLEPGRGDWVVPRYVESGGLRVGTSELVAKRIDYWLERRSEAKKAKAFARADAIRATLSAAGIIVEDKPNGQVTWKFDGGDVDLSKLESLE
jgi:cysteinyl-tRNA synthetase